MKVSRCVRKKQDGPVFERIAFQITSEGTLETWIGGIFPKFVLRTFLIASHPLAACGCNSTFGCDKIKGCFLYGFQTDIIRS